MKPRIFHFRDRGSSTGGALTVAARIDKYGYFNLGFCFCSPQDQFSRKEGRKVALKRMNLGAVKFKTYDKSLATTVRNVINLIFKRSTCVRPQFRGKIPGWAGSWWANLGA